MGPYYIILPHKISFQQKINKLSETLKRQGERTTTNDISSHNITCLSLLLPTAKLSFLSFRFLIGHSTLHFSRVDDSVRIEHEYE
jgi:hypothetical protein